MKHDLAKFLHWLHESTFRNKWIECKLKNQLISLLSWIIYPDYRSKESLFKILKKNLILNSIMVISLLWGVTFFTFGRLSTSKEKILIHNHLNNMSIDTTLVKLIFDKKMRIFIEYNCKEKYKIKNYNNLQKLPDEILFTIVSEIIDKKIPPSLFFRLIDQESHFLNVVNKKTGASGLTQILPSTQRLLLRRIGPTNHAMIDNIRMGSYHLKVQYDKYINQGFSERESWLKSLMDYNGGSRKLAEDNLLNFVPTFENIKTED